MDRPSLNSLYEDRNPSTDPAAAVVSTRRDGIRRSGIAVMLAGVLAMLALMGSSCTRNAYAYDSAAQVNATRSSSGLSKLSIDDTLVAKAQAWAERMASAGTISHSQLTDGAGSNWSVLAENVGMASTITQMHSLFMNSPSHRANIVNGSFDRIGTGVAESGGRLFVVQVFAG
ncbi:MAG: CAP domain-containing protein [Acidimicrobiales bacterium]